ncbi:hypothetical protein TRFO_14699 [Tritrichomonas foetus]|uniref:Uncharacterized protein n=1 Tax=Tritrichomonas foetus TaxID=1144522 RepID=A0A1J4KVI6_9EUKA|nr:hypothetical protein TRFO_14699 [Tritrichomonas foetus]|eukprot:OHT14904.1 hypothetical protein TRFO_14699 [Tritrichomonas foetus]
MTNPNNVSTIVTPISAEDITAVAYFKPGGFITSGNVWFGSRDGSLYVAQHPPGNMSEFIFRCRLQTARQNFSVNKILSVRDPSCVIVHWIGGSGQPGPVQLIYPGGIRVKVVDEANDAYFYDNKTTKYLVVVVGQKIRVYNFQSNVLLFKNEYDLTTIPTACDLARNSFIYYGNGCYSQIDLLTGSIVKLLSSAARKPFVYRIDDRKSDTDSTKVFLGDNDFIRVTSLDGKEPGQVQYDRTHRIPNFMLPCQNCLYQFFGKIFTRADFSGENATKNDVNDAQVFNIPDVSKATMVDDCLLIISSNSVQIVGTMEDPSTFAKRIVEGQAAEVDNLLSKLPNEQASQTTLSIFDALWRLEKRVEAFSLLSRNLIVSEINRIISLVPILIVSESNTQQNASKSNLKPVSEDDKSLLEHVMQFLSFTHDKLRNKVKYSAEYKYTNTALAQCYASFSKTRELDALIKEGKLDLKIFQQFLTKRGKLLRMAPAGAVLKSNVGEVADAMAIWRQLDDALKQNGQINPLFISEASYTLQMSKDSTNLAKDLDWIYERDPNKPELALNAILSVNHDSEIVDKWIKSKNLESLKLRYSVFIVTQPSTPRGSTLANETFISLLDILSKIDSSDFDIQQIQFTQAFLKKTADQGNDAIKSEAKEEIVQYELQILNQHSNAIVQDDVKSHLNDNIDKRIIFALYRVKGEYETGIQLLTANNEFPQETIEEFCRLAPEPPKAFSVLLRHINKDELVPKYYNFILGNIEYMDLAELVSLIPRTHRVKEVQVLLKKCYNLLHTRLNSLYTQIAVAKSMQVDMKYRKVKELSNYCLMETGAKCAACGEIIPDGQQFVMTPGGINQEIYHPKCKPTIIK